VQGESDSFFREELERLRDIDQTSDFRAFRRSVKDLVPSMGALLFHKAKVVDAITESLANSESLAWKTVLHFVGVLARDLRSELYPEVPRLVSALASMFDPSKVCVCAPQSL
jgi:hypothetical protein